MGEIVEGVFHGKTIELAVDPGVIRHVVPAGSARWRSYTSKRSFVQWKVPVPMNGDLTCDLVVSQSDGNCSDRGPSPFDRELAGAGSVRRFFFNVRRLCSHVRRLCSHRIMAFPSRHGDHCHPPAALAKTCDGQ